MRDLRNFPWDRDEPRVEFLGGTGKGGLGEHGHAGDAGHDGEGAWGSSGISRGT
jgi:hypothetical protein